MSAPSDLSEKTPAPADAGPESRGLSADRRIAALCSIGAVLLGAAGLAGWGLGLPFLTRIVAGYKAIAPSVAVSLIMLGSVQLRMAAGVGRRERVVWAAVVGLIFLFGALEVIGLLVGADLNLEDAMTQCIARVSSVPFQTMSPVAGAILFLVGAAMLALLVEPISDQRSRRLGDAGGALGLAAAIIAVIFGLGYAYGAPLLYGSPAIPISLMGCLGGLLLALGAVAAAGPKRWPLGALVGDSARARLLRAFVPLTVLAVLSMSIAHHRIPVLENLSHVVAASLLAVAFALVAGLVASRVARGIGETIDRARLSQQRSEQALREAKDHLEMRVKERTAELERINRALQEEATERQRAEQAVKAERQRFNDILETLPAYLLLLTPDYHVAFANRFFRERFGESHGRRCFEYLWGRSEPCEVCETYKTLKTMAPLEWEWTGPDGRNYYIFDFPFTDTDGSTLIMEVGIDITERKWAEEELRRHQERLEQLVEERTADLEGRNAQLGAEIAERRKAEEALRESQADLNRAQAVAHTGSWRLNVRRNELLWSDETHRMFGIPKGTRMTYETFLATIHPQDREYVDRKWAAALRGEPYEIEHRIVVGDAVKWVRERAELEFDKEGKLLGGFGTAQDITERKRAEQQLLEAERLRAQMAETVALEINHRMKNNLMLVSGILELQLTTQPAASDAAAALRQARARISALSTVHEQMYEQRSERVELSDVLRRIAEMAIGALAAEDVALSVSSDPVYIPSRAATTLAVVSNELITNALKYGAPGSDGKRRVDVALSHQGGKLRLRVWSSGNPVPADFDPDKQKGLGLHLCRELVGGELRGSLAVWAEDGGTMSEIMVDDDYVDLGGTGGAG